MNSANFSISQKNDFIRNFFIADYPIWMMFDWDLFITFAIQVGVIIIKIEVTNDINRIKVVFIEKKRTNKWLAKQLGKDPGYGV